MNQSKISVRYAKAFFQHMLEKQKLDAAITDVQLVYNAIQEIHDLQNLLQNPIVKPSQKKIVFDTLLSKKVQAETLRFFYVIIDNSRENLLADILRNFIDMYRSHKGITKVTVTTATKFSSQNTQEITDFISEKFNTKVELHEQIDNQLIGGFVLRINDLQYDASVKSKIKNIKKEMLKIV
ncbi:MAG: ATP synthase F1 subunit delta [Bacteroidales bacterium]|nr:ATP synthase F1 subunit delta [Bacteroidales bacterium]NLK80661.1 ATP synthase F1 subunit delta [Bacteroidales bacterium]